MQSLKYSPDLGEKLLVILKRLADSSLKVTDDVLLEKLLGAVRSELSKSTRTINNLDELINWFNSTLERWAENPPSVNVLVFVMQLIGILSGNEAIFKYMYTSLSYIPAHHLKKYIYKNMNLILTYVTLLSNIADHKSGCQWIMHTKLWREVVDLYFTRSGLFIEREGINMIVKFLRNMGWQTDLLQEILDVVLEPLQFHRNGFQLGSINEKNMQNWKNKFETKFVSVLSAYIVIVEACMTSDVSRSKRVILQSKENELFWKYFLETSDSDNILEKASIAYTLQSLSTDYDLNTLAKVKEIPDKIFEVFKVLVKRKKLLTVIKLAKYCQIFWNKMSDDNSISENYELESHFIAIQIMPAFTLLNELKHENTMFEMFIKKLFNFTHGNTMKLCYIIKDVIKYEEYGDVADYAFVGISSACKNMDTLNLNRATLIFQSLACIFKIFVPECRSFDDSTEEERLKEQMLCHTKEGLLSSVLCALYSLIEKFKINCTEALEGLCLLKLSSTLLSNPNLSPRLGVQTLSLIKIAILNVLAPNSLLSMNDMEGTSIKYLLQILYNKLHDPNWEIRDSCVEVIGIIAELSDTKYPAFQKLLIQGKYCELILSMSEGDAESYVRSSALRALSEMIKIESMRNQCLNNVNFISKISSIIRNESEGIVRREAALLAKDLFETQSYRSDSLNDLYHTMGYAAVNDLHWEVKMNALIFWEKVIQKLIADQGMLHEFYQTSMSFKDNIKTASLTTEEIKLRLEKVLSELSNTGCLFVLITTLKDDYDFQVVKKSAQILTDLTELLKRYDFFEKPSLDYQSDKCSVKRKLNHEDFPEKKILHTLSDRKIEEDEATKSNSVIQDIINEFDVSLLEYVYTQNKIINSSEIDTFSLKQVKPDLFLNEIQNMNINSFWKAKSKWLLSGEDDLNELLNDMLALSIECETNTLDCY